MCLSSSDWYCLYNVLCCLHGAITDNKKVKTDLLQTVNVRHPGCAWYPHFQPIYAADRPVQIVAIAFFGETSKASLDIPFSRQPLAVWMRTGYFEWIRGRAPSPGSLFRQILGRPKLILIRATHHRRPISLLGTDRVCRSSAVGLARVLFFWPPGAKPPGLLVGAFAHHALAVGKRFPLCIPNPIDGHRLHML